MRYSRDYRANLGSWNGSTRVDYGTDYYGAVLSTRGRTPGGTELDRGYDPEYRGRERGTLRTHPARRGYDTGYRSRDWGDRRRSSWRKPRYDTRGFPSHGRGYDRW